MDFYDDEELEEGEIRIEDDEDDDADRHNWGGEADYFEEIQNHEDNHDNWREGVVRIEPMDDMEDYENWHGAAALGGDHVPRRRRGAPFWEDAAFRDNVEEAEVRINMENALFGENLEDENDDIVEGVGEEGILIPREDLLVTEGRQRNSERYICQGYNYHRDRRHRGVLRCSCRGRRYRAVLRISGNEVRLYNNHIHLMTPHLVEEASMRREILRLARETSQSPDLIYREAAGTHPNAARYLVSEAAASAIVSRERARNRPPIPATMLDMDEVLRTYRFTQDMYRGQVHIPNERDGDAIAQIFIEETMLQRLNNARHLHFDGTFKVTPFAPRVSQLLVIHMRVANTGFAAVYVLMQRRTEDLYAAVIRRIKQLAPGLQGSLQTAVTDFERPLVDAIAAELPDATRTGCGFHFRQATRRYWVRCGLSNAPREALYKTWALSHTPPAHWNASLQIILRHLDQITEQYPQAQDYGSYLRRQWAPLAGIVFTRSAVRTNNLAEAFNRYIVGRLGGAHANIWAFFEKMRDEMGRTRLSLQRVMDGNQPRNVRNRAQLDEDLRIVNLQALLDLPGRLDLDEFLNLAIEPARRRELDNLFLADIHGHLDMEQPLSFPGNLAPADDPNENLNPDNLPQFDGPVLPRNEGEQGPIRGANVRGRGARGRGARGRGGRGRGARGRGGEQQLLAVQLGRVGDLAQNAPARRGRGRPRRPAAADPNRILGFLDQNLEQPVQDAQQNVPAHPVEGVRRRGRPRRQAVAPDLIQPINHQNNGPALARGPMQRAGRLRRQEPVVAEPHQLINHHDNGPVPARDPVQMPDRLRIQEPAAEPNHLIEPPINAPGLVPEPNVLRNEPQNAPRDAAAPELQQENMEMPREHRIIEPVAAEPDHLIEPPIDAPGLAPEPNVQRNEPQNVPRNVAAPELQQENLGGIRVVDPVPMRENHEGDNAENMALRLAQNDLAMLARDHHAREAQRRRPPLADIPVPNPNQIMRPVQQEQTTCIICVASVANTAFGPCGHVLMCQGCTSLHVGKFRKCSMCQTKREYFLRLTYQGIGTVCCKCNLFQPDIAFMPCDHVSTCHRCTTQERARAEGCPTCRQSHRVIRIYPRGFPAVVSHPR